MVCKDYKQDNGNDACRHGLDHANVMWYFQSYCPKLLYNRKERVEDL